MPCRDTFIDALSVTFLYIICFLGYCTTVLCTPFVRAYTLLTRVCCCRHRPADCDGDIEQLDMRSQDAVPKDLDPQRSPGMARILEEMHAAERRGEVARTASGGGAR
ncbi:hypothetical protein NpNSSI1_00012363 [Neofusicoccum parvum]|nr:hypothetical protein NpNSSI1_00012363 [Neofusicoccum parvum]